MSSRANKPDTQADIDLRSCLEYVPPRSFMMKAGAGSEKLLLSSRVCRRSFEYMGISLGNPASALPALPTQISQPEKYGGT